ncbi:HutD family protein [Streptomyces sp. NBC_00083]|uniref:HutD/Ves family protein n=1 Tax=Streptomyces sp. NBC_00083 TaxID=2975647 RepID=UPI00225B11CD|nr:HutD family protein [Streptomyces sp. NBC_00083]MCX5383028.1 HutD family protein [Streptomyces sp. NBC_00083]
MKVLRAAGRVAVPWRNGGGVTRGVAAHPEGAGTADFAWRVSLADVAEDGPFSGFPGVDRILTVVEGAGMDLTVDGRRRLVDERFVPQHFPGDAPTDCRLLAGPVVNFNVMYRRGRPAPTVAVVRGALRVAGPALIVALDAPAHAGAVHLDPYDAVLTGEGTTEVRAEGHTAVVTLPLR